MKYIIKSSMCPIIYTMPGWNYSKVGAGSEWWGVPLGTTWDDLIWEPPVRKVSKSKKFNAIPNEVIKKYRSARDGRKIYTVKALGPYVTCDCAGFSYRRFCKHTEAFKNEWKKGR